MALAFKFLNISHVLNLLMLLRTLGLYIFGVGINLPTSSQDMASNRAPDLPKWAKIIKNQAFNHKNPKTIEKNPHWKKFGCTTPFLRALGHMRLPCGSISPLVFSP
jgi:hypothetical protein